MRALPKEVRRTFGVALYAVQIGETPPIAKPLPAMKRKKAGYEDSSGNVFADIGFRNAKQELLKAKLTVEIYRLLKKRGVTQQDAAKLLGTTQAQVSALMRCKPVSVSVGRLMEFLTVLGQDIEVTVKPAARRKAGDMSVVVKAA